MTGGLFSEYPRRSKLKVQVQQPFHFTLGSELVDVRGPDMSGRPGGIVVGPCSSELGWTVDRGDRWSL